MASVANLIKSLESVQRILSSMGFESEIDSFKSGNNRFGELPSSYVELIVRKGEEKTEWYKFRANGYDANERREFGGESVKEMKRLFWNQFNKDFKVPQEPKQVIDPVLTKDGFDLTPEHLESKSKTERGIVFAFRSLTIRVDMGTFTFHVYRGGDEIDPVRGRFTTKEEALCWIMSNIERDPNFAAFNQPDDDPTDPLTEEVQIVTEEEDSYFDRESDAADLIAAGFGDGMEIESPYQRDRDEFKARLEARKPENVVTEAELRAGKHFFFSNEEYEASIGNDDIRVAEVFIRVRKTTGREAFVIFFNGYFVHTSLTFGSMIRRLGKLAATWNLTPIADPDAESRKAEEEIGQAVKESVARHKFNF